MDGSGKTRYKKIGKQLGLPWTVVRDRALQGLTSDQKADQDPLGAREDYRKGRNRRHG
jgi:hypothetical protein